MAFEGIPAGDASSFAVRGAALDPAREKSPDFYHFAHRRRTVDSGRFVL
jgi:hypothetical protein